MSNNCKDLKQMRREAESRGWRVEITNGGHLKWSLPGRGVFFTAQTPGDRRAMANMRSDMRKIERGQDV